MTSWSQVTLMSSFMNFGYPDLYKQHFIDTKSQDILRIIRVTHAEESVVK